MSGTKYWPGRGKSQLFLPPLLGRGGGNSLTTFCGTALRRGGGKFFTGGFSRCSISRFLLATDCGLFRRLRLLAESAACCLRGLATYSSKRCCARAFRRLYKRLFSLSGKLGSGLRRVIKQNLSRGCWNSASNVLPCWHNSRDPNLNGYIPPRKQTTRAAWLDRTV